MDVNVLPLINKGPTLLYFSLLYFTSFRRRCAWLVQKLNFCCFKLLG